MSNDEIKQIGYELDKLCDNLHNPTISYNDRYFKFYNYCEKLLKKIEIEHKSIFDKFEYYKYDTKEYYTRTLYVAKDVESNNIIKIIDYCYYMIDKLNMPYWKDGIKNTNE